MNLFIELILVLSVISVNVNGETFDQCKDVPSQTFIASPDGCEFYIYCNGDQSSQDICPDNLWFSAKNGSCNTKDKVDCNENGNTTLATTQLTDSSANTTLETTPLTTSTLFSPTPNSSPTSDTTSTTNLNTTSTASSISTSTSSGVIQCPTPSIPDEISYVPSPTSCKEYYMCYRGTSKQMTCPVGLEFNPMTLSCDWAQSANCKIIGSTTVSPKVLCTNTTSGYFDYPSNCHIYYRCTNGMLTVQECPAGYGWKQSERRCTDNACKSSSSGFLI